jgi:hypothetical protein
MNILSSPDTAAGLPVPSTPLLGEQSAKNATHLLICKHNIGRNGYQYEMPCHVLSGRLPSGKVKVRVWGSRNWIGYDHVSRVRYVWPHKIKPNAPLHPRGERAAGTP